MNKSILIGVIAFVVVNLATLFLPIELYNGEAVFESGETVEEKLSLSYLVNKEKVIAASGVDQLVDIRLKAVGWIMILIVNIGLPVLIGYRVSIYQKLNSKKND